MGLSGDQKEAGPPPPPTPNPFTSLVVEGAGTRGAAGFASRSQVRGEKDQMIAAAGRWNETSSVWTPDNQCAEQADNLANYLQHNVKPKYWDPRTIGGNSPFFGKNLVDHHHAVLVEARPIAERLGFNSFVLDPYKNPLSFLIRVFPAAAALPSVRQAGVKMYAPEQFRQKYPYRIPGEYYP